MKNKIKAVVAGHACLDLTPKFRDGEGRGVDELLVPGRLINVGPLELTTGGAVLNTGFALRIMGADVTLMGLLGDDELGAIVREKIRQNGVTDGMQTAHAAGTSYSVVLTPPGTDRIFLHDPGANDAFGYSDIAFDALRDAQIFHFGYPPIMRRMFQNSGAELVRIFEKVDAMGIATSLDMAAVDPESAAGQADWPEILRRTLPQVDFFVPSIEETAFMLDRAGYELILRKAAGGDFAEHVTAAYVRALGEKLIELGAGAVLLKCGVSGLYFRASGMRKMERIGQKLGFSMADWAEKDFFQDCFVPRRVRSATGAGDTAIAAFLMAALRRRPPEDCVRLAAAAGAACVEEYGSVAGLCPLEELDARIESGWQTVRRLH